MYDNIDFTLYPNHAPGINFLSDVPPLLTTITSNGYNQFGAYVTGYLDSLKVSITESRLKISDCSLCKYFLGDNFKTLSKSDTRRAIEKISDILKLPFDKANITRIDLAKNIILTNDMGVYLPYLGEANYYKRLEQNNGLYYQNKLRQLVFYGKVHEQKEKRQPIPELYIDRNVLRYEMRYRKRLREQFNLPEITAGLLYNEDFYYSLVKRWKDEYFSIQKINSKFSNMKPTGKPKELLERIALMQILETGQPHYFNLISQWQKNGDITKKQAHDHRKRLKELTSTPFDEQCNDLIQELDKKIMEASKY